MEWNWSDLLWHVLLIPVYQVLSTTRHEVAHAVVALLSGFNVLGIWVLPHRYSGRWCWGRVSWEPKDPGYFKDGVWRKTEPTVHMQLAPYYVDLVCIPFGVWLMYNVEWEAFHLFTVAVIMLVISPVVDMAYNILKWVLKDTGDWAKAMRAMR